MSRRQAFGILTNNNSQVQLNDNNSEQLVLKQQPATNSNNDNGSSSSSTIFKQQFGFEIYVDKENIYQQTINQQQIKEESPMVLDVSQKIANSYEYDEELGEEEDEVGERGTEDDDYDDDNNDVDELKRKEADERDRVLSNCEEYAEQILIHLKELELKNRPKSAYLKQQQDITSNMRSILVDWLVEVAEEYKLHTETLYLAVNYTDRFLSKMSVLRGKLQLLGTASMYIASKYEEIFPPDVNEFVYITDDTYTKQQVLRMEHLILKVLNFHMNAPTANCFLLHFIRYSQVEQKCEYLARYLSELTLIEADPFLEYVPSIIASSALYLSMLTFKQNWNDSMIKLTGYTINDLKKCIIDLYKRWSNAPQHAQQAVQDKYRQERFNYVALVDLPELNFD